MRMPPSSSWSSHRVDLHPLLPALFLGFLCHEGASLFVALAHPPSGSPWDSSDISFLASSAWPGFRASFL